MGKPDTRYLERHGSGWRVVVPVPRKLHQAVGSTKLKRPLATDSLIAANVLKWPVIAELKRQIKEAAKGGSDDALLSEALAMRDAALAERRSGQDGRWTATDAIDLRSEELRGQPVADENGQPVYDPDREAQAGYYAQIANGRATPLQAMLPQWHSQSGSRKERTKGDDVRALGYLNTWCAGNRVAPIIEAIARRVAGDFIAALPLVATTAKGGQRISNRTVNKYVSSLSAHWKWLVARGVVSDNPWKGQHLPKDRVEDADRERPFTREEMIKLLSGKPLRPVLPPLMRIAALSGARIDAIVSLRVKDCADGAFRFKRQKRETSDRLVPIHSALADLVAHLVDGKAPDDAVFPAFPIPPAGSQRERSSPAVKAFRTYRKGLGVDERREGRKRSLVNFHSFRRWFITEAERAGIRENIIASVVGHKRAGMTFGVYSAGPEFEQLRECVEAVKLPSKAGET